MNLGPMEIVVIFVVALIVLGPQRLPEAGRQVGKFMRDVRRWSDDMRGEITEAFDVDAALAAAEPTATAKPAAEPTPAAPPVKDWFDHQAEERAAEQAAAAAATLTSAPEQSGSPGLDDPHAPQRLAAHLAAGEPREAAGDTASSPSPNSGGPDGADTGAADPGGVDPGAVDPDGVDPGAAHTGAADTATADIATAVSATEEPLDTRPESRSPWLGDATPARVVAEPRSDDQQDLTRP
jgi:sec-independent protein translocase protein TatB